ncbi:MAG: tRNA ((37)-N1)-methyltransferase TrmD [Pseudomonadota bacterium]|jgi:tRNA (guanine37-N1)-methyltransferase
MKFSVITLFPDLISQVVKLGVVGQAVSKNKIQVNIYTPRMWTHDVHKTVDDRPFGGGDGMVMMAEPLHQCVDHITTDAQPSSDSQKIRKIFLSPQGRTLTHELVMELAKEKHLLLLCGRYAGVDQRFVNHHEFEEISLGDYVLSGGELGALVVIDAVGRQIEGVLGHEASSTEDSFAGDGLLESPCYTRPREWQGQIVPEFLLTGNHAQIAEDRWLIGVMVTFVKRPDLFESYMLRQVVKKKVWQRAMDKLKGSSSNALTSLGLTRKNLEDFENQLHHYKVL